MGHFSCRRHRSLGWSGGVVDASAIRRNFFDALGEGDLMRIYSPAADVERSNHHPIPASQTSAKVAT